MVDGEYVLKELRSFRRKLNRIRRDVSKVEAKSELISKYLDKIEEKIERR